MRHEHRKTARRYKSSCWTGNTICFFGDFFPRTTPGASRTAPMPRSTLCPISRTASERDPLSGGYPSVRSGPVRSGPVRSGPVREGQNPYSKGSTIILNKRHTFGIRISRCRPVSVRSGPVRCPVPSGVRSRPVSGPVRSRPVPSASGPVRCPRAHCARPSSSETLPI